MAKQKYGQNKIKDLIKNVGFPNPLAPDEEKAEDLYGLQMKNAIEYEWFYRPDSGSCSYMDKRDEYHRLRLYARGEQPTNLYKDLLVDGGDSYSNYDWRPLPIIPKFVNLIVNQMTERLFDVKAEAIDKFSTDLKDSHKRNLEDMMMARPVLLEAQQALGVDLSVLGGEGIPETQEEIELYMKLRYKPAIEIASEEAIKFTLDINDYEETQKRVVEDIVDIGIGALKHRTDPSKGIMVEYVDPANMVYSYPVHRNFKDVHYYGEVKRMTIMEAQRLSNGKISDEELQDVAKSANEWSRYHGNSNDQNNYREDDLGNIMVDVLFFTFRSNKTLTYKKKYLKNGGYTMNKKASTFSKKNKDYKGFDVKKRQIDVWYEGTAILGTQLMWDYGVCQNMIRPKGSLNKTVPNYIVHAPELYQNRSRSLVKSIITYVDQMQQIHIKLQQLIAKARPNGIYIDVDGLEEIALGDGSFLTPLEAIKIYNETGNVIGTSVAADGGYNNGRIPIQELKNGVIDGLDRLISSYNHYLNLVRDAIGIPQGVDASTPHPDALVGVQQMLAANSNTATRHILDAMLSMSERLGEALSLRLKDIFKYENLREAYTQAIGAVNVKTLESLKDYHLHDIGVLIKLKPDAEERQYLEQSILKALELGQITIDDSFDVRSISNTKLAMESLKVKRARRERLQREHELAKIETQSKGAAEAAERTAQAKMKEIQFQAQAKIMEVNAQTEGKIKELAAEEAAKSRLMDKEFQFNMQLKGMDVQAQEKLKEKDHADKTKRQDRNNSQASKLIEQRQVNAASLSFESSEDNLSGDLGMGQIGPK